MYKCTSTVYDKSKNSFVKAFSAIIFSIPFCTSNLYTKHEYIFSYDISKRQYLTSFNENKWHAVFVDIYKYVKCVSFITGQKMIYNYHYWKITKTCRGGDYKLV